MVWGFMETVIYIYIYIYISVSFLFKLMQREVPGEAWPPKVGPKWRQDAQVGAKMERTSPLWVFLLGPSLDLGGKKGGHSLSRENQTGVA